MHISKALFWVNGIGEILAGVRFIISPPLGVLTPLDANARFLFTCWAMSIIGFGLTSILNASDAQNRPERTMAFTVGAIFYHVAVSLTYACHMYLGVLTREWVFGTALHIFGVIGFFTHFFCKIFDGQQGRKSK